VQKIATFLTFIGQAEESMNFSVSLFDRPLGWARQGSARLSGKELTCSTVMTATDEPLVAHSGAGR
jgi:predicted 3-demethylubiquinone-9 3-methyltransferase (glyoxalase superfamily)